MSHSLPIHDRIRAAANVLPPDVFAQQIETLRAQALRETDPATQGQILGLVAFAEDQLRETAKRKSGTHFGQNHATPKPAEIDLSALVPVSVALLKVGGAVAGLWLIGCAVVEGAKAVAAFIVANATWFGLAGLGVLALVVSASARTKGDTDTSAPTGSSGQATFNFNIHVGNDGKLMQQ